MIQGAFGLASWCCMIPIIGYVDELVHDSFDCSFVLMRCTLDSQCRMLVPPHMRVLLVVIGSNGYFRNRAIASASA